MSRPDRELNPDQYKALHQGEWPEQEMRCGWRSEDYKQCISPEGHKGPHIIPEPIYDVYGSDMTLPQALDIPVPQDRIDDALDAIVYSALPMFGDEIKVRRTVNRWTQNVRAILEKLAKDVS